MLDRSTNFFDDDAPTSSASAEVPVIRPTTRSRRVTQPAAAPPTNSRPRLSAVPRAAGGRPRRRGPPTALAAGGGPRPRAVPQRSDATARPTSASQVGDRGPPECDRPDRGGDRGRRSRRGHDRAGRRHGLRARPPVAGRAADRPALSPTARRAVTPSSTVRPSKRKRSRTGGARRPRRHSPRHGTDAKRPKRRGRQHSGAAKPRAHRSAVTPATVSRPATPVPVVAAARRGLPAAPARPPVPRRTTPRPTSEFGVEG